MIARFKLNIGTFQLDVDLTLPPSGITVLFGHSGSGKTTVLRCIAGLHHAPRGFLQINGNMWQDSDRHVFLPTYKRSLGYVFQAANLFPHLTVVANLQFGLKRVSQSLQNGEFENMLALLGIEHLLKRLPNGLSGGEQQRVAIARALLLKPDILLMDEPLASLDFKRKQDILPYLQRIPQQTQVPIVYVTHSLQEATQLSDYVVVMEEGRVLGMGALSEMKGYMTG